MGKSSLVNRTIVRLRQENIHTVNIDLTAIGTGNSREQWYFGLLDILGRQLGLQAEVEAFLDANERLDPLRLWMLTLETVALAKIPGSLVVFIDEIEVVKSLPFSTDEFFAAVRACYNKRAENKDYDRLTFCLVLVGTAFSDDAISIFRVLYNEGWERLIMVLCCYGDPNTFIKDAQMSPFNVGVRLEFA